MSKFVISKIAFSALILLATSLAFGSTESKIDLSKGSSQVEFLAIGKPSLLKIKGAGGKLGGNLTVNGDILSGKIDVDLNAFDTGIELRNEHMREKYLQTSQFPKAELTITKLPGLTKLMTDAGKLENAEFEGTLKLHGVEKPLIGKLTAAKLGNNIDGKANFKFKISDYNIDVPSYMGIKVSDEVEVESSFNAPLQGSK